MTLTEADINETMECVVAAVSFSWHRENVERLEHIRDLACLAVKAKNSIEAANSETVFHMGWAKQYYNEWQACAKRIKQLENELNQLKGANNVPIPRSHEQGA